VKQWNDGKQAEYCRRRPFRINLEEPGVAAAMVMKPDAPCDPPTGDATAAIDPACADDALQQMGSA
jgi:hypothetical protein